MSLSRFSPAACGQDVKVFWFFFSKKNCFPSREKCPPQATNDILLHAADEKSFENGLFPEGTILIVEPVLRNSGACKKR
jgi:hypothetical protein